MNAGEGFKELTHIRCPRIKEYKVSEILNGEKVAQFVRFFKIKCDSGDLLWQSTPTHIDISKKQYFQSGCKTQTVKNIGSARDTAERLHTSDAPILLCC